MNVCVDKVTNWLLILCGIGWVQSLAQPVPCIEVTAEIETCTWPYRSRDGELDHDFRTRLCRARCILIGDRWFLEGDFLANATVSWWFTGSNLVQQTWVTGLPSKHPELYARNHPESAASVGKKRVSVIETVDGNPGRLPRSIDLLLAPAARVCWLAFCSASCVKRPDHQLFPPDDSWKQSAFYWNPGGGPPVLLEELVQFEDGLGLPQSVDLLTRTRQPIVQYRTGLVTNVLGWRVPLEFFLAQYRPAGTNRWELHMNVRGKVNAVQRGAMPEVPAVQTR